MKRRSIDTPVIALVLALALVVAIAASSNAQEAQQQSAEQDKDKPTPEKKAVALLDQLVGEASALKLPENRIYIEISAADILWDRDEARARGLFIEASGGVADLLRRSDTSDRRQANANRIALQLRQELVLTAARHDSALAYQLLQAVPAPANAAQNGGRPGAQNNLEQALAAAIAANDPKTAIKNAQGWLDKGEYPSSFQKLLSQLQQKDSDAATKLTDQLVKKLQPEEIVAKQDAMRLSLSLLRAGPRPDKKNAADQPAVSGQILAEAAYRDLMSATITAALKATPSPAGAAQRGPGGFRGGPGGRGPAAAQAPQTEADIAQTNERAALSGLQNMLQQVDQYLPERSLALRQKITQMGMDNDPRGAFGQMATLMQQGTSDSLMAAASSAPQGMQNRLYQQAAMKALDEGNPDRAREIANQHFDGTARDNLLHAVEMRQATRSTSTSGNKMDEIRAVLAKAQSDEERVGLLLQFANTMQNESPKLALQLLDEARGLVAKRATGYAQLETQINVAHAVAALDPARAFDTLEPGITQINELLSAAAVLNGFEVNLLREGELPLQQGGTLAALVSRYGSELSALAKTDFERAQLTAERFQLPEPRILAKLALVRGVLGANPIESGDRGFGFRLGGGQFARPQE